MRLFILTTASLCLLYADPAAQRLNSKLRRSIQTIGKDWFSARPASYFEQWDTAKRAALLERARAVEALPPDSLAQVVELLWKAAVKQAPAFKGKLDTPYGKATWIQKGKKKSGQGLVIGLHGGGPGSGSADGAASNWPVKGYLCMYPQGIELVSDTWNTVHGERFLLSLIEFAKLRYDVDPDRVYVMGFSMGGTGSWFMAGRHPDLLAGAIPGHGVIMAAPKAQLQRKEDVTAIQHGMLANVRNLAVYFYTGTIDTNCMPGTFLFAWDVLQGLHKADPEGYGQVKFTLHEGLAHEFPPGEPAKGIEWVTQHRRDALAKKLVWEYASDPFPVPTDSDRVSRPQKHWYYWLHCDDLKDGMHVTAVRDGNSIDLQLTGVQSTDFTIYLNPKMIDVAQPVVVKVNGEQVYADTPRPSFAAVLESLDARVDRRLVFDRKIEL